VGFGLLMVYNYIYQNFDRVLVLGRVEGVIVATY